MQIIIEVLINGKSYNFCLDTGASTSISNSLYKDLKPSILRTVRVSDSSGNSDSLRIVDLKALNIGDVVFRNTPTLVVKDSNLIYKCLHVDGTIGSNLLRKSIVRTNQKTKEIVLTNDIKKLNIKREKPLKIRLTKEQSLPIVSVKLKGYREAKIEVLFDTGMQGLFDLSVNNYKELSNRNLFTNIEHSIGTNSVGLYGIAKTDSVLRMNVPELIIGNDILKSVNINSTHATNSRLGLGILPYMDFAIDYLNKRLYFFSEASVQCVNSKTLPISATYNDDKYLVGCIWRKNDVPNIGLGDEILKVNDINCSGLDVCDLMMLMKNIMQEEFLIVTKNSQGTVNTTRIYKK